MGLQRRHEPRYIEGVKRLRDGAIGDLRFLRVYWNGDEPWVRPRQPEKTEMEYQMRNWYFFVWLCGDNICEQHVHNLDVATGSRAIIRSRPTAWAAARSARARTSATFSTTTSSSSPTRTGASVQPVPPPGRHLELRRRMRPRHQGQSRRVSEPVGARRQPRRSPYVRARRPVKAIRDNDKYNEGWYGATSSMTAVLGRMATYSGQVVHWDDAVAKGPERNAGEFRLGRRSQGPARQGRPLRICRRRYPEFTSHIDAIRPSGARS